MEKTILTLSQFERFCRDRRFSRFVFEPSALRHSPRHSNSKVNREYGIVVMFYAPNIAVFKKGQDTIYFRYAKRVEIVSDDPDKGILLDLICSEDAYHNNEKHISFTAI